MRIRLIFHRKWSNRDIGPCSRFETGDLEKGSQEGNPFHEGEGATIGPHFKPGCHRPRT